MFFPLQMKIIYLQEDISVKIYKTASTEDYWAKYVLDIYMNCEKLAIKLTIMFSSKLKTLSISFPPRVPNLKTGSGQLMT